jgi:hypothetical protein
MASFNFTTVALEEGATFIFGSWVFVTNSIDNIRRHLIDIRKSKAYAPTSRRDIDDLVEDLDEIQLSDLIKTPDDLDFSLRDNVNVPLLLRLLISTRN